MFKGYVAQSKTRHKMAIFISFIIKEEPIKKLKKYFLYTFFYQDHVQIFSHDCLIIWREIGILERPKKD